MRGSDWLIFLLIIVNFNTFLYNWPQEDKWATYPVYLVATWSSLDCEFFSINDLYKMQISFSIYRKSWQGMKAIEKTQFSCLKNKFRKCPWCVYQTLLTLNQMFFS